MPEDDAVITPPAVAADPPVADDAARNAEADNKGKLIASLQEKAARVNTAEREAAEWKARAERAERAQTPAAPSPAVDPRQQRIRDTYDWAQGRMSADGKADPVAGALIDAVTDLELTKQRLADRDALDDIEDKELRKQVKAHYDQNRHRLGDVAAAQAEIMAGKYADAEAERVRLAEALRAAQAPTGTAPPTHHRDVPATTIKAQTFETLDEFNDAMKGMTTLERMAVQAELGKSIKIKRGM